MKNIFKTLFAVGVLFAAIGCDKDQTVTKFNPGGEDAESAYFTQKTVSEEFATTVTGNQTLYVDLFRQNAQGELTVGLDQVVPEDAAEFYEIPEYVTFKDGEYKVAVPVTIHNVENYAKGVNYTAQIFVGDHHDFVSTTTQLVLDKQGMPVKGAATRAVDIAEKYSSVTITTTLTLEWEPCYVLKDPSKLLSTDLTEADYVIGADGKPMLQGATYTYTGWWSGYDDEIMLERAKGTTVFRMTNWGGGVNIIFTVKADKSVVITGQYIGADHSSYGKVYVSDVPSYAAGASYEQYPCTWDGGRNFSFSLIYYVDAGNFGDFVETLELHSGTVVVEDPEPAVAIEYLGASVSATGVKSHKLSFKPNDDAAYYYATVLKTDPQLAEQCAAMTEAVLKQNGIQPGTSAWYQNYDPIYAQIFEGMSAEYAESLYESIGSKIEDGSYEGDYPAFRFEEASEEAWDLGTEGGTYTAVAFSYDKTEQFKGADIKVFIYNPGAEADKVAYTLEFGVYPNPASGYFAYNSANLYLQSANGDITSVKYAFVSKADFEAAGLSDASTPAELEAYVGENGKALGAAALEDVNNTGLLGGYELYLDAAPATDYKLITCISNADATKTEVSDMTTDAVVAPNKLAIATSVTDIPKSGVYKHTHVVAAISGTEIVSGYYMMAAASNATLNNYITVSDGGQVALKEGVTDADMLELIEGNGTAFSAGTSTSALAQMNNGGSFATPQKGTPATKYVVLGCAVYGNGEKSWTAAVQTTGFAPSVAFVQTVQSSGKNIVFNWSATPSASIFMVQEVVYALVPKSALSGAGVDFTKLSDEQLNDFDARRAEAGSSASEIDAQEQNAAKVMEILDAQGKTFKGDAATAINYGDGVSKQFSNVASGEYALIALASDSYNTKLTVGLVIVQ